MISCAMTYAGAALPPKNTVSLRFGNFPLLISRYFFITYKAFICWRLYSWNLLIWVSIILFSSNSIPCVSFKYSFRISLFSCLISSNLAATSLLSTKANSFSNLVASVKYSSPISSFKYAANGLLENSNQRLNVIPLVLLLNFSGYNS